MNKLEQAAYDEALRLCAIAQKRTARDKRTIARLRSELEVAGSNERARIVAMLRREAATYDVEETENVALRQAADELEGGMGAWA